MHEPELADLGDLRARAGLRRATRRPSTRSSRKAITPETFTEIVHDAPGVTVQDEPSVNMYPTPWSVAGRDDTYVGRIRQDVSLGQWASRSGWSATTCARARR